MTLFLRKYLSSKLPVFSFAFWLLLVLVFPIGIGILSVVSAFKLIVFLFASVTLGFYFLGKVSLFSKIPELIQTGIAFITGSTVIFILLALLPSPLIVYIIATIFLIATIINKQVSTTFDANGFAAIVPLFFLLFNSPELLLAKSTTFVNTGGDYFYYDALVVSLSKTLSIFDAVFHKGAPISYPTLPFFSPAAMSYFTGITGHTSFSSIYVPLLKTLSFGVFGACIIEVLRYFKPDDKNLPWTSYMLVSALLVLLAPLHPLYVTKADLRHSIALGEGYLLPLGSMGTALAILLFGCCNLFVFSTGKKTIPDTVFFVIALAAMSVCKAALFYPVTAFYGFYFLFAKGTGKQKIANLALLFASFVIGFLLFALFVGNGGGLIKTSFTPGDGYYLYFFEKHAPKFHLPATPAGAFMLFIIMLFIWLGLKTVIFITALITKQRQLYRLIFATLLCIMVCALPPWFLKILFLDDLGRVLVDDSLDAAQFLRGGLFVSTYAAIICLLILFLETRPVVSYSLKIITVLWACVSGISLYYNLTEQPEVMGNTWEKQVINDFKITNPSLMAMQYSDEHSGQALVAMNVQPWWICCKRTDKWGSYLNTLKPVKRNYVLARFFADSSSAPTRTAAAEEMIKSGVDYIVATPDDVVQAEKLRLANFLSKEENVKWIYRLQLPRHQNYDKDTSGRR